jgi:pyridoxamine 5'-phosphate oxidase
MKGWYEEVEKWPEATPATTGATNKKRKLVDVALGNFALVLIEPTFVDWIQLGTCCQGHSTLSSQRAATVCCPVR